MPVLPTLYRYSLVIMDCRCRQLSGISIWLETNGTILVFMTVRSCATSMTSEKVSIEMLYSRDDNRPDVLLFTVYLPSSHGPMIEDLSDACRNV